ncbi:hypothetical protein [Pseudoalteromonas sp.]|uniref:hypothetical protein n=1 Tax=Pseudoalteromonas sp. TaxID=53249 RepID=UPI0035614705
MNTTIDNLSILLENRIAKDLSRLPLPDPNKSSAGNTLAIETYIAKLNQHIDGLSLKPKLLAIQSDKFSFHTDRELIKKSFETPNKKITFTYSVNKVSLWDYFSLGALFASLGFYFLIEYRYKLKSRKQNVTIEQDNEEHARLVIDLEKKLLINSRTHASVPLANKPLCFFTALIDYCLLHPDVLLNQNKDLPDELVVLSNKYFYRLTELGHTIRKRPNFSNSLEKTLSEIRAALDEILVDDLQLKEMFFPPKAHGEGSRSKLHHYGLKGIESEFVEVIGK